MHVITTLRDLQSVLAEKITEMRQRHALIDKLEWKLDEKDNMIQLHRIELEKYKPAVKVSIKAAVQANGTDNNTLGRHKRTAISARIF